jgi:hypothetical protein
MDYRRTDEQRRPPAVWATRAVYIQAPVPRPPPWLSEVHDNYSLTIKVTATEKTEQQNKKQNKTELLPLSLNRLE